MSKRFAKPLRSLDDLPKRFAKPLRGLNDLSKRFGSTLRTLEDLPKRFGKLNRRFLDRARNDTPSLLYGLRPSTFISGRNPLLMPILTKD